MYTYIYCKNKFDVTLQLKDKVDPAYQHDFDHIKQENCQYGKKKVSKKWIDKCLDLSYVSK
jgi:hypothetical protein